VRGRSGGKWGGKNKESGGWDGTVVKATWEDTRNHINNLKFGAVTNQKRRKKRNRSERNRNTNHKKEVGGGQKRTRRRQRENILM